MTYWLFKSEPDEFSIENLRQNKTERWDGIRNYQARNFMRTMTPGDLAFFYHSSCNDIGLVGTMKIISSAYPDPLAVDEDSAYFDKRSLVENKWLAIDVQYHSRFKQTLTLAQIKTLALKDERLAELTLIKKGNRLSIMPITPAQWQCLFAASDPQ